MSIERWEKIIKQHEGWTWDEVVECSTDITRVEARRVEKLGYYGFPVREGDAEHLDAMRERPTAEFVVNVRAVDGSDSHEFETGEAALEWVKARAQWWNSSTYAQSDYAHYSCRGFENPEWKAEAP